MRDRSRHTSSLAPYLVVLILGVALRFLNFNFQSLWYDEVFSVVFSSSPTTEQLFATLRGDFHPPLYFLTLRAWLHFFGAHDTAARLLSVLIGSSALVIVWLVIRECLAGSARITALVVAATSLTLIWYSQEVRQYGLLLLTGAATLHSTLRILRGAPFAIPYCVLASVTLLYTHYAGVLAIAAVWLAAISMCAATWRTPCERHRTLRAITSLAITHAIVLASFMPWLPTFLTQRTNAQHALWIPAPTLATLLELLPRVLAYRLPWDTSRYNWWLLAVCVLLSYLCLTALTRNQPKQREDAKGYNDLCAQALIVCWIATPIICGYILSLAGTQVLYFRNVLYIAPALSILLGQVSSVGRWGRGLVALVIAASLANLPWYYGSRHKEDWRRAVPFITERVLPDSAAIFDAPGTRLAYDYYASGITLPQFTPQAQPKPARVFYIRALSGTKVEGVVTQLRAEGYSLTKRKNFPGIVVIVFDRITAEAHTPSPG
jgi:uncharacterized membrane protein